MSLTIESELKYRAETEGPLERLAQAPSLGPASLGKPTTALETDRYLDTDDGRLSAAGWACRLRFRDGEARISLKGPARHARGASLHLRPELEGPAGEGAAPEAWPPSEARDLVLRLGRDAALVERLTLEQRRTERAVWLGEVAAGTLSLDRARVLKDGSERGWLLVVELELDARALDAGLEPAVLAAALAEVEGLAPDPASKLERALEMVGLATNGA
jgi:inorganic triphosphatase YgiF